MQFILGQPLNGSFKYFTQASPILISFPDVIFHLLKQTRPKTHAMMVIPDKTACPEDSSAEKPRSGREREKGGCNCYEVQMVFQTSVKSMRIRNKNNKIIY